MKKKICIFLMAGLLSIAGLAGCASQSESILANNSENDESEEMEEEENDGSEDENKLELSLDFLSGGEKLTLEDLGGNDYVIAHTSNDSVNYFTLEKDGSFEGWSYNRDTGVCGTTGDYHECEGFYVCNYKGKFSELEKVSQNQYKMHIESFEFEDFETKNYKVNYHDSVWDETREDITVMVENSHPRCYYCELKEGMEFSVYTQGTTKEMIKEQYDDPHIVGGYMNQETNGVCNPIMVFDDVYEKDSKFSQANCIYMVTPECKSIYERVEMNKQHVADYLEMMESATYLYDTY